MALQASGQISLDDLHVEAGGTTGTECSLNDTDIRDIISKGDGTQNSISEYYGQSSAVSGAWLGYSMRLPDGNLSWTANLSTPAANRYIVVYSGWRTAVSSSVSCSVNIAGQTTTRLAQLSISGSNRTAGAQVDIALVPTGTTGTISLATSSGSVYQSATAWVMYGITPTYASFAQSNAIDANVSINVQEGDMVIAGCGSGLAQSTSSRVSWTGVSENFDFLGNENNERHMSAGTHFVTSNQSPRTIIADRSRSDASRTAFAMAFR